MESGGKAALLLRALTGAYAVVRHPLPTLLAAWQAYWARITVPRLPVADRIGNDRIDANAYSPFDIPNLHMAWDIPIHDLFWLTRLVTTYQPKRIMEFGTFTGLTTFYLAKYSAPDALVTTIDLPDERFRSIRPAPDIEIGMRFKGTPEAAKIRRVAADLARFQPSDFEPQDFIFVDAMHFYEDVRRDTENAFKLVSPGGLIVWHDYNVAESGAGVVRCLDELAGSHPGLRWIKGTNLAYFQAPISANEHTG